MISVVIAAELYDRHVRKRNLAMTVPSATTWYPLGGGGTVGVVQPNQAGWVTVGAPVTVGLGAAQTVYYPTAPSAPPPPRKQHVAIQAITNLQSCKAVILALKNAGEEPDEIELPLDVFAAIFNEMRGEKADISIGISILSTFEQVGVRVDGVRLTIRR